MANQFDDIDIFDTSQDVGSIEPTGPQYKSLSDTYFDYLIEDPIAKQVTGGDPLKKALRFVSEFVPGVSTELALRENDPLGVALSSLDLFPATKLIPPAIKREAAEQTFKFKSASEGQPYKGISIDKRQPIEVLRMPDGSLQQIGGKSTREATELLGETEAP